MFCQNMLYYLTRQQQIAYHLQKEAQTMEINYNGLKIEVSNEITTTAGYLATAQRCRMSLFVVADPGSDCFGYGDLVFMSSDGNEGAKNATYLFLATPEELARAILMQETENGHDRPIEMLTMLNDSRQNGLKHYACGVWVQSTEFFTVSLVPFLDRVVKTLDQKPLIVGSYDELAKSTDPRALALRQQVASLSDADFAAQESEVYGLCLHLSGDAYKIMMTTRYAMLGERNRRNEIKDLFKRCNELDEARAAHEIDSPVFRQYTSVIKELCLQIDRLEVIE